jgi:hypothetical protein
MRVNINTLKALLQTEKSEQKRITEKFIVSHFSQEVILCLLKTI